MVDRAISYCTFGKRTDTHLHLVAMQQRKTLIHSSFSIMASNVGSSSFTTNNKQWQIKTPASQTLLLHNYDFKCRSSSQRTKVLVHDIR